MTKMNLKGLQSQPALGTVWKTARLAKSGFQFDSGEVLPWKK
jgi:hypothetical protein